MSEITENTLSAYLGPEFQQRLMWQLLVEPEFAEKTIPNLAVEYFDDPNLKRLFIIILEYFKEYEKVPNLQNQSIQQAINKYKTPNNIIEEESLFAVIKRIEMWNERVINKQMLHDGDVVQKTTSGFIKQQEYRKLGEHILEKTKNGEIRNKHTLGAIEEKIQKISHIGDEEDYGTEVIENIDKVLRKEFRETIATGVDVIDGLTGGGLGKGEIGVILSPSGAGKTTLLTKIANTAYEIEKNVLQVIFEDTTEQIQRKHYTIWSKTSLSKIDDEDENIRVKKIVHEKAEELKKSRGKLIIKKFSQENTTMMDVRNWMIRHQKKWGYKFDILVLDYLDCLESHKKTADRNEAELVIVKSFEALATDFDIPGWTAIQSNRSGFDAEFVEAHQTGGSIKRVQKAHFFMSVAKTKDQKEAQLANIRIIKARFAQDGQTFQDCIFNNDTMEIRIEDDRYKYNRINKNTKHYDSEDVDKIDDNANKIHIAISQHTEAELTEKVNDDNINEITVKDVTEMTSTEINDLLKKNAEQLVDNNPEITKQHIDNITTEINNNIANTVKEKESFEWDGESGNTTTEIINEQPEVKFDNVEPLIEIEPEEVKTSIIVKNIVMEYNVVNKNGRMYPSPNPEIKPITEIERRFIDPDAPHGENKLIQETLAKLRKNQNVIKKE